MKDTNITVYKSFLLKLSWEPPGLPYRVRGIGP
nr:MAG TPA: hypothetical protein [Bacteriophage sp.]